MFLKYFDFIIQPFRKARAQKSRAQNVKGNIKVDVNRAKAYKGLAQQKVGQAGKVKGQAQKAGGQAGQIQGQAPWGAPGAGTPAQEGGAMEPNPPIVKKGVLFWKKHICAMCSSELDKTWDACPYCAQAAQSGQPQHKTRAIMLDAAGGGQDIQLLGWIVPVKGPERGELYTLAPVSTVGTDPSSTVCLSDQFMSATHAEIKAEGGVWVLRDLGSTNGTFVNDKRIDQHELVDNDFVRFGQSLVKFKSL